jgi:mutator protein MutT
VSLPRITVVAAVVEREGTFLLTRRLAGTHLAGMWEFPGGKCHAGETDRDALTREMREELDVAVSIGDRVFDVTHAYPERTVELHFYRCALQGTPRPLLGQEMRWVPREELAALEFPPADRDLIELLRTA